MIVHNLIDGVSANSFVSHITKPDISFVVSMVSQIMKNPTEEHMEAVYRILTQLKMTAGKDLFLDSQQKGS